MNLLPEAPPPTGNAEPLYNIGVVTRLTAISMATLRAWERRYNFPEASRSSGGHRLYSEKDIMRLRWVKSRIDSGMQTSQAIQALRHQETAEVTSPVRSQPEQYAPQQTKIEKSVLQAYKDRLLETFLHEDLGRADQILAEALVVSSPEDIILHLISPSLAAIGDAWEANQISVAAEHLATNFLRQRLLMWMVSGPPPQARPPVVLACAPNEWHEGSLLILGALLRRRRWSVAYLGQAVPLADLASFVRDIQPSAVILVAMTEEAVAELPEWTQYLPEAAQTGKPVICFGGRVFVLHPEWQSRVPGVYLGSTIEQGLEKLEGILTQSG